LKPGTTYTQSTSTAYVRVVIKSSTDRGLVLPMTCHFRLITAASQSSPVWEFNNAIQHRCVTDVIRVHRRSSCPEFIRRRNRRHLPTWVACCSSVVLRRVRGHHGLRCTTPRTRLRGRRRQHTFDLMREGKAVLRSHRQLWFLCSAIRHDTQVRWND